MLCFWGHFHTVPKIFPQVDRTAEATAVAVEETELIVIQRDQLMQPMDKADPMVTLLLRMILERFGKVYALPCVAYSCRVQ